MYQECLFPVGQYHLQFCFFVLITLSSSQRTSVFWKEIRFPWLVVSHCGGLLSTHCFYV